MGLVNTCCDTFCILPGMGCVWSHVVMRFVFLHAWDAIVQHKLGYILCHPCHGRCFVNTCWVAFSDLDVMGGI